MVVKTRVVHSEVNNCYRVQKQVENKHWFRTEYEWLTFETFRYRVDYDDVTRMTQERAEELAINRAKAYATDEVIYES